MQQASNKRFRFEMRKADADRDPLQDEKIAGILAIAVEQSCG